MIVTVSLMVTILPASACRTRRRGRYMRITSPIDGSTTGIVVDVEGIFRTRIPHPGWEYWILVSPEDSDLVHPGAPIVFSFDRRLRGTWSGLHSIYLTGDPAQASQPFRIMVAKVTPKTHALYVYRLQNQIYDYIEMLPGTIVLDWIIVERLQ